ncbi:MAG: DUF998 domain-containing protein [Alphaproteobacteria bacterium]|nr:DUF998 domain-containing protein [Alphaproteobacteria bacterium]
MTIREFGIFGLAATILFVFSLVVFAELSPGYTHATKAVSELGAIGAPHQLAWNIFGFLLPGLMMAAHGWGIGVSVNDRVASLLFSLSGLSFAVTSVPADMMNYSAPSSQTHIAASIGVFGFWLAASLKITLRRSGGHSPVIWLTSASLWLAAVAAVARFSGYFYPGTGQRFAFAAFFVWVLSTSLFMIFARPRTLPL